MRPERCWPLAVGVFRWIGMPRGGRVGGPELPRRRCARLMLGPGRWRDRSGPLSGAGSCRPPPDRQCEATSPDRGRRGMMPGDRFGSLVLQGFTPVLGPQRLV